MRNLLPVIGFALGVAIGILAYVYDIRPPLSWTIYLGLASVAGLDSVFGGIRSGLEGKFQNMIFVSGLIFNALMAAMLAWFGTKIGLRDLFTTAVVVVLGGRIFVNLSVIRRYAIEALAKRMAATRGTAAEVARAEE